MEEAHLAAWELSPLPPEEPQNPSSLERSRSLWEPHYAGGTGWRAQAGSPPVQSSRTPRARAPRPELEREARAVTAQTEARDRQ